MATMTRMIALAFALSLCIFLFLGAWGGVINAGFIDNFYHKYIAVFFGEGQDTGPKPEDTLIAPFSTGIMIETQIDLSQPHRTVSEMANMLSSITSELFTVDPVTYNDHLASLSDAIKPAGIKDFSDFMISSNILPRLEKNNTVLNAFVEETPTLVKDGVFSGHYKWVFKVPITITELYKNTNSYQDVDKQQLDKVTTRLLLQVQMGRVDNTITQNGAMIERIKISLNK